MLDVLSPNFSQVFKTFPPEGQRQAVDLLKDSIRKLKGRNLEDLRSIGVAEASNQPVNPQRLELEIVLALDKCNWQLSLLLRYSNPSRMEEAEPYIRGVIDHYKITDLGRSGAIDQTPLLYLANAISTQPGREDEAVKVLGEAMEGSNAGPNTFLWAQAAVARALRRAGRLEEAQKLEKNIIDWFEYHPYGMPPSQFRHIISDDKNPEAPNPILEHPKIKAVLNNAFEIPNFAGGMFGNAVVHMM